MPLNGIAAVGRWNALIRTHHITSRKKVARLRQAAATEDVYALLHSGRPPGIMYVEGDKVGVESWVTTVQVRLRHLGYCSLVGGRTIFVFEWNLTSMCRTETSLQGLPTRFETIRPRM